MLYLMSDGRIIYDKNLLKPTDIYKEAEEVPISYEQKGKIGYFNGLNKETLDILFFYLDEPIPESIPEPEPTDQELIQAELLLNQTQILINQEQQDMVLAELLLNQIGGV